MRPYYLYILFAFTLIYTTSNAQQKRDYVWQLGLFSEKVDPHFASMIDFTKNPGKVVKVDRDHDMFTNASIADTAGNLLFYTNGCFVFNAEHEIMPHGDSLNLTPEGEVLHVCNGPYASYRSLDGAMILPQPENDSLYFLFHYTELLTDTFDGAISLNYTLVNMNLDGGRGDVVEKNVQMRGDWVWNEELQAVRHANNRDWWIVVQDRPETDYLRWLLTPTGLQGPWVQQGIGQLPPPNSTASGQAKFSPDGTRYARTLSFQPNVSFYDFDRATGLFSNYRPLPKRSSPGGLAFSPSGQYLYCHGRDTIFQWDTWDVDEIADTRTVIGITDDYDDGRSNFGRMVSGPDCRIYVAPRGSSLFWHVINWPDRPGLESDLVLRALEFPTFTAWGLPNFPNYRLGTGHSYCDMGIHTIGSTITSVSAPPVQEQGAAFSAFPNPASHQVQLSIAQPHHTLSLELYNSMGQRLKRYEQLSGSMHISVSELPQGIYFLILTDANGKASSQKLNVIHK